MTKQAFKAIHAFRAVAVAALSLLLVAPAAADTRPPSALLGFYVGFVRSMNPHLALSQCRVYAQDLLANAQRLQLDPALLAAIVTVESHWNPSARSWRGAEGLGQLMPDTARELGVDPSSGRSNLLGTSIYLHRLLGEFRGTQEPMRYALAGYNAGPGAVKRYGGVPPISETQHYVVKVMRVWKSVHDQTASLNVKEPVVVARVHPARVLEADSRSFDSRLAAYWEEAP